MNADEAIAKMVPPGQRRPGKWREGVIQIWVTRACDKSCFGCTQGSNLSGEPGMITPEQFEVAVLSLRTYFGVVGVFGGNPAVHPKFGELCEILRAYIPFEQRGLWCNNPITVEKARIMAETFNPRVSNLNVHLDPKAFSMFKMGWPDSMPFGLEQDSRHSPPFVAIKDVLKRPCRKCSGYGKRTPEGRVFVTEADPDFQRRIDCPECQGTGAETNEPLMWDLISDCDINKHWSAMIGVFRGELRAWFCEIAGAQAMLHQHEPDYPDTGLKLELVATRNGKRPCHGCQYCNAHGDAWKYNEECDGSGMIPDTSLTAEVRCGYEFALNSPDGYKKWWELPITSFANQIKQHCPDCGVPLRGRGSLAQASEDSGVEQTSYTHAGVFSPKRKGRRVELVMARSELGPPLEKMTDYLGNAKR